MKNVKNPGPAHAVVSREEWLRARTALLAREKEHTRQRDELGRERRALPWVRIEKPYRFESPHGAETLADLFRGRSQLIVYHFMFGPDWEEGCPSCSLLADHIDGALVHLEHRDVTLLAVSRAPLAKIQAFQRRMGWRFPWVSSHGSDFNHDFGVSFTSEELARGKVLYNFRMEEGFVEDLPGISSFFQDEGGRVYHTYSTYARGCEPPIGVYDWLDYAPKGRDEDDLAFTMAWVRHHDRYGAQYAVDRAAEYRPPAGAGVRARE
jgi:predicted dithiol-disulfide oxidoreductase (DUF899 family)